MLFVFTTVGRCHIFQVIVFVGLHLLLTMPLPAPMMVILHHNEIKDITAQLMSEVCPNVATEPTLQTVSNIRFVHHSANTKSGARFDVRAHFDVRVFNPLATTNRQSTFSTCFRSHDCEKHRVYEQQVREIERGSFTPLVFSALGGT